MATQTGRSYISNLLCDIQTNKDDDDDDEYDKFHQNSNGKPGSTKKVSLDDFNNEGPPGRKWLPKPEILISRTMIDSVEIPTAIPAFSEHDGLHKSDGDNDR